MPLTDDEYLAKLLAEGDWREADNPNTGGKYYYHKKTRESVKTLKPFIDKMRKEDEAAELKKSSLQQRQTAAVSSASPSTGASGGSWGANKPKNANSVPSPKVKAEEDVTTEISITASTEEASKTAKDQTVQRPPTPPPVSKPAYLPEKGELAAAALASGEWIQTTAYNGEPFYIHQQTRESTGDLGLYLQIQYMLKATEQSPQDALYPPMLINISEVAAKASFDTHSSVIPLSPRAEGSVSSKVSPLRSPTTDHPPPQPDGINTSSVEIDLNDWTTVALQGPQRAAAAARLIDSLAQAQGGYPSERLEAELRDTKEALRVAREELASSHKELADQAQVIEELQKALYYGITPIKKATSSVDNNSTVPAVLGHLPRSKASHTFVFDGIASGRHNGVPMNAHQRHQMQAAADQERIAALEAIVRELQQHNLLLREALNNAKVGKHIANDCGVCEVLDPWKRLMTKTMGIETFAKSRVDVTERIVDTASLYQNPLGGLPARSEYQNSHHHVKGRAGAAIEDRSLQDAFSGGTSKNSLANQSGGGKAWGWAAEGNNLFHEGRLAPTIETSPVSYSHHLKFGEKVEAPARAFRSQIASGVAGTIVPHDYGRVASGAGEAMSSQPHLARPMLSGTAMISGGINTPSSAILRSGATNGAYDDPASRNLFTAAQLAKASYYQRKLI